MEQITFAVVSLNPGVDHTLYLDNPPVHGGLNRIGKGSFQQGSKGVNLAVVLKNLGACPRYYAFTGGALATICNAFTEKALIPSVFVPTAAGVRVNTKLVEADGTCTELNERGGPVTEEELQALLSHLEKPFSVLCLCGSLPEGVPANTYRSLIASAKERGAITVLDCDGYPFVEGLAAGPHLVKPNKEELCRALGVDAATVNTVEDIAALCRRLRGRSAGTDVICTMGGDGAIFVGDEGEYIVSNPKVEVKGTAGAGDTFLAAFISRRYGYLESARMSLGFAAAAATAKVTLPGTTLPTKQEVRDFLSAVSVREL